MDDLLAPLDAIVGERVQVICFDGQRNATVLSIIKPLTNIPPATIPIALRVAIGRSLFTVRFDDGVVLEYIPGSVACFPSLAPVRLLKRGVINLQSASSFPRLPFNS
jgi:hypothetical protein